MGKYPKKRNGDEYYLGGSDACFEMDENGKELYARDRKGKEFYPKRDRFVFARDVTGEYYYAKDAHGNEYYPVRENRSLFLLDHTNDVIRLALMADGTQRYPRDGRGNEYYLKENAKPLLMRKNTGEYYLAQSRKGYALIPWNHMQEYGREEPCLFTKDADGNTVYLKESDIPSPLQTLIRCMCHISIICPRVTGCHTQLY